MFEKVIATAQAKGRTYATIRKDTVIKLLRSAQCEQVVCNFHYTDDYAWDNANDFGRGQVSPEGVAEDLERYGHTRCYIDITTPNQVKIRIHSNLVYTMYVTDEPKQPQKVESAPVETVSGQVVTVASSTTEQVVSVTLNDEKHGVEIRFSTKPDQSILAILRAAGFRWGRGYWWAKQTPERIALANDIWEQIHTCAHDISPVADVEPSEATATVHDTPAQVEVEAVESDPYATPAYAPNCHMKAWNDDADQLADVFNALDIPYDIAGDKFIFRNLTPEQYAHVVRINETNQAIIFDDGDSAVSEIYDRYRHLHDKSFTYQVGDNDPIEVIDEVNEPAPAQLAEVVSISQYRAKSWHASMTAEQHFKCMLLGEMLGAEEVAKAIAHGTTIDQLFTTTAEVMMKLKKM